MAEILSEKIDPSLSLRMTVPMLAIAQDDSASEWVSYAEMKGVIVFLEPLARIDPLIFA